MLIAASSLLDKIHPLALLKPLYGLGQAAFWWMLLGGILVALGARRSPRSSAWWALHFFLTIGFLRFGLKHSESPWVFAALAGTGVLLWVVLAPLYTRWHKLLSSIIWTIAGLVLLFDVAQYLSWWAIYLATSKAGRNNPWLISALGMWQMIILALLAGLLSFKSRMFQPWFRQLSLVYLGVCMGLPEAGRALAGSPLFHWPLLTLTLLATATLVSHLAAEKWPPGPDILDRYRPFAIVGATHIFLICFTIATLYPVLWVLKMAVTPQQGFILGINPVPQPLVRYINAKRRGDAQAAACYQRAMLQNFREVMGQGSACTDQICSHWRQYGRAGSALLKQRQTICSQFAAIMSKAPKFKPKKPIKHAKARALWRKRKLDLWRKGRLDVWKKKSLASLSKQGRYKRNKRARVSKLLNEIVHQQKERNAQGKLFWRQVLNSILVALATTLLGLFLACTAAYAFSRFRFPGRRMGLMGFLVSQMFPGTLMMIPLYILISRLGLLNSLVGLTLVYSTTSIPFCVWMLKGYFDTIPKELEEAALIDGASRTLIFWKIMLPLARPAIAVTALFSFMTAWNEFILAITFMNDKTSFTLPVMLRQYVGSHNTEWGHFAAGAVLVSLPIVLLFFLLQKNLVGGLTAGSVKG